MNLSQEFDVKVWVKEWMETINKNPDIPKDEGAMIAWFANAIMAGYDNHMWKHPDVYIQMSNSRSICGVWMYEPSMEERVGEYNKYMKQDSKFGEDFTKTNTWIEKIKVKY